MSSNENTLSKEEQDLITEQEREIFEHVVLGEEARKFLTSDLAKFIRLSADKMVVEAQEKLAVIDATDVSGIREQQTIIARFDHFERRLMDLVAAGQSAYQIYVIECQEE